MMEGAANSGGPYITQNMDKRIEDHINNEYKEYYVLRGLLQMVLLLPIRRACFNTDITPYLTRMHYQGTTTFLLFILIHLTIYVEHPDYELPGWCLLFIPISNVCIQIK